MTSCLTCFLLLISQFSIGTTRFQHRAEVNLNLDPTLESPDSHGKLIDEKDENSVVVPSKKSWAPFNGTNVIPLYQYPVPRESYNNGVLQNQYNNGMPQNQNNYLSSTNFKNIFNHIIGQAQGSHASVSQSFRNNKHKETDDKSVSEGEHKGTGFTLLKNKDHGSILATIHKSTAGVCKSKECLEIARNIKEAMNVSVSPCDDFYTYACGGWKSKNPIPSSENEITAFTKLTKKIEQKVYKLLQEPPKDGESEALVKARKFYDSCMDTEEIERLGAKPAKEFIKSIGGWALCNNSGWESDGWKVHQTLRKLQGEYYPAPPFFTVEVTNDHLNSTRHLIKVRTGILHY